MTEKIMKDKKTDWDERVANMRPEFLSGALMAGATTWWSTLTECQQEVGRFLTGRLEKDAEAIRQTLSCRDWTEALDIQARWMEETLRDYNAEMSKLTGLYAKTLTSTVREERRRS
jgi:Phasin protein